MHYMLTEDMVKTVCKDPNFDALQFIDDFLEEQIAQEDDPSRREVLNQLYAEAGWWDKGMQGVGAAAGRAKNFVPDMVRSAVRGGKNAIQNIKQGYQTTQGPVPFQGPETSDSGNDTGASGAANSASGGNTGGNTASNLDVNKKVYAFNKAYQTFHRIDPKLAQDFQKHIEPLYNKYVLGQQDQQGQVNQQGQQGQVPGQYTVNTSQVNPEESPSPQQQVAWRKYRGKVLREGKSLPSLSTYIDRKRYYLS